MLELPVGIGHGAAGGGSILGTGTDGARNEGRHTAESVSSRQRLLYCQSCDGINNELRFKQNSQQVRQHTGVCEERPHPLYRSLQGDDNVRRGAGAQ